MRPGVRPQQGEVLDIFIIPWREVIERSLYDAENCAEAQRIYTATPLQEFGGVREAGRSMSMRMCYRPYMYDPALLPTLGKIRLPTLVVWGAQDQIIPSRMWPPLPTSDSRSDAAGHRPLWPLAPFRTTRDVGRDHP